MNPAVAIALRDVVDRYADAVDRRDADALVGLFTDDGVLRVQADGGPVENEWTGSEVVRSLDVIAGFNRTFHHVGGCVFEATGEDRATGRVQCLAHHYERTGNGPVDLVMMIRYHDVYVQRAAVWQIAERRVAIEWTELHPAHPRRKVR
ncbi:MAG TPA: nuclear transport factor 2 family protein [Acidimicrobiales bacterium]|nr:nuclear transport factor 2 family protein [Acidimicrobiales bacterium]